MMTGSHLILRPFARSGKLATRTTYADGWANEGHGECENVCAIQVGHIGVMSLLCGCWLATAQAGPLGGLCKITLGFNDENMRKLKGE